jgi:amino acid transporter
MRQRVSLLVAIFVVAALSIGTATLLKSFQLSSLSDAGFSWAIATKPIADWVNQLLVRRQHSSKIGEPIDFFQPWYELLAIGSISYMGALQFGGFVFGVAYSGGATEAATDSVFVAVALVTTVATTAILAFYIGSRAGAWGVLVLLGACVAGKLLGGLADYAIVNEADYERFYESPKVISSFLANELSGVLFSLALAIMVGLPVYFVGRRRRYARYLYAVMRPCTVVEQRFISQLVEDVVRRGRTAPADPSPPDLAHALPPVV